MSQIRKFFCLDGCPGQCAPVAAAVTRSKIETKTAAYGTGAYGDRQFREFWSG